MRDLSRQSDHQVAPADRSDCKYQVYTVFHSSSIVKMTKMPKPAKIRTKHRTRTGNTEFRSRVTDLGPGHLNFDPKDGLVRDSLFPICKLRLMFGP